MSNMSRKVNPLNYIEEKKIEETCDLKLLQQNNSCAIDQRHHHHFNVVRQPKVLQKIDKKNVLTSSNYPLKNTVV